MFMFTKLHIVMLYCMSDLNMMTLPYYSSPSQNVAPILKIHVVYIPTVLIPYTVNKV